MKDVALEMELMPAAAYEKAQCASGRVTCLIQFRSFRDRPQEIFIPSRYREVMTYILNDMNIDRTLTLSTAETPSDTKSRFSARFFPMPASTASTS